MAVIARVVWSKTVEDADALHRSALEAGLATCGVDNGGTHRGSYFIVEDEEEAFVRWVESLPVPPTIATPEELSIQHPIRW